MLPRLGHGTICGTYHQDRTVHLGSTRDHVLDVVGVPGAVHVGVVAVLGGVLLVAGSYGDARAALSSGALSI